MGVYLYVSLSCHSFRLPDVQVIHRWSIQQPLLSDHLVFIGELTEERAVEMACTVVTEVCVVSVISLAVIAEVQQRSAESEEKSREAQRLAQDQREVRSSSNARSSC